MANAVFLLCERLILAIWRAMFWQLPSYTQRSQTNKEKMAWETYTPPVAQMYTIHFQQTVALLQYARRRPRLFPVLWPNPDQEGANVNVSLRFPLRCDSAHIQTVTGRQPWSNGV